jgi:CheY-like chemotaxis protein
MSDSVVVGGQDIVRLLPQAASFYAAIGPPVNLCRSACDGASTPAAGTTPSPVLVEAVARILIAEDEDAARALCARVLCLAGHEVATAGDGGEAFDVLTREQGRFDLLLTDICMPIMDGVALALAAARDFPGLTILLMTACDDRRERARGLDAPIHEVLAKPFSLATLRGSVSTALAARGWTGIHSSETA